MDATETVTQEAIDRLTAAEVEFDAQPGSEAYKSDQVDTTAQQPEPAAKPIIEAPTQVSTDTPATAKTPVAEPVKKDDEKVEKNTFRKDQERLQKTWKAVNDRKAALDAQEAAYKANIAQLAVREQRIQQQAAKANAPKYTPEQYDTAATTMANNAETLELQATGMEAKAQQLEDAGNYAGAEQARAHAKELRKQSNVQEAHAKQAKNTAAHMRANPDKSAEQAKATDEAHRKHYSLEAAKRWPDLTKTDSEFTKIVAGHLRVVEAQYPAMMEEPSIIFHMARLTAAEIAAARVPVMDKELGELRAKVKELEALTNPGGGTGSVQQAHGSEALLTLEQEEAELRQMASQQR
jgi:hypothetical protein